MLNCHINKEYRLLYTLPKVGNKNVYPCIVSLPDKKFYLVTDYYSKPLNFDYFEESLMAMIRYLVDNGEVLLN